ncbi:hypothetical protein CC86DRAFT_139689 [Ophiobolus disseminans]|uniref:Uncharacterized protein n=1 Tax=Ophiobolus disseminans TaxID=1469910 RepID=A0A6A7AFK5_9PLEO|nr:hypothetical protein CC86DRAFT_139689 [Ophiobolus disseminans]
MPSPQSPYNYYYYAFLPAESSLSDLQYYFTHNAPTTATEWHYYALALFHYQEAHEDHESATPLVPEEYFSSQAGMSSDGDDDSDDEWTYQQPHVLCPGGPQLDEGEIVLTSIELPPIADLISFPWTPVGVGLPPLRYLDRGVVVKEEDDEA